MESSKIPSTNPSIETASNLSTGVSANKPFQKKLLLLVIVLFLGTVVLGIALVFGLKNREKEANLSPVPTITTTAELPEITTSIGSSDQQAKVADSNFNTATSLGPVGNDEEFEINGLYFVQYKGTDGIFAYYQNSNTVIQELDYETNGTIISTNEFDENDIVQRVLIFRGRLPLDDLYLSGFSLDPDRKFLYFALVSHSASNTDSYPDTSNVFRYDFAENKTDILVQKKINFEEFLEYSGGFRMEKAVSDKHLALSIGECYACDEAKTKTFVLNTEILVYKEVIGEDVTDITYLPDKNQISYRTVLLAGYGEDDIMPVPTYKESEEVFFFDLP